MSSPPLRLVLVCSLFAAVPGADVLVVDAALGPGADHDTIQGAVDAAEDGDTILVRDGNYASFSIQAKGLVVVADGDGVFLDGHTTSNFGTRTEIEDLAADQEVVLRGLRMNYGIRIQQCEGRVWLDEIDVEGAFGVCPLGSAPGLTVSRSDAVVLSRSRFVGETNTPTVVWAPMPSDGMSAILSTVVAHDCVFVGGDGANSDADPFFGLPANGACGASVSSATVTFVGCSLFGGAGGILSSDPCNSYSIGGAGLEVKSGAIVHAAATTANGGVANLSPLCPGAFGPAGPDVANAGTVVPLPGFARSSSSDGPVRGGEVVSLVVEGQPADVPVLLASSAQARTLVTGTTGAFLLELPHEDLFVLPPLDASGRATLSFAVPNVGRSIGAATYYLQAVFVDATPSVWLGAGTTVTLLDASF